MASDINEKQQLCHKVLFILSSFSQSPFVNEILTAVWEQTDSVEKSVGKLEFSEASEKSRISQSISTESQVQIAIEFKISVVWNKIVF